MKKIIKIFSIVLILFLVITTKQTYADNYKMMELIPQDKKVTVRGDIFLYKDVEYKDGKVTFGQIKNITDENRKVTISLAFFDEERYNITIINYCSDTDILEPNAIKENYVIQLDESNFREGKKLKDIKYYAFLSENKTCRLGGEKEYVGRRIEDINRLGNSEMPSGAKLLLKIVKVIAIILIILFLIKFLFTGAYRNMNGDDVRAEFDYVNKQKEKERKRQKFLNPKVAKEKGPNKSDKILSQEESENKQENKDNSDLHNMYK